MIRNKERTAWTRDQMQKDARTQLKAIQQEKDARAQIDELHKWEGCYDSSWKGMITNESFAHPAKFRRGLIERILDYCLVGYLSKGDVVGDPFGGIGTGGIISAYLGLRWVGCELEPRFVKFASENFELHRRHWEHLGLPLPRIIQGDSRKFDEYVAGIVSSLPYADIRPEKSGSGVNIEKQWETYRSQGGGMSLEKFRAQQARHAEGTVQAVVSSPPYSNIAAGAGGFSKRPDGSAFGAGKSMETTYGQTYGQTEGQIGKEKGETYWFACDQVYRACFRSIRPGGVIVLVVKDYCAKGKRVRLCDDTLRLLEHIGFQPLERIHAMLVTETVENGLFGEEKTKRQRKSFFRRLYEAKLPEGDDRRIDFEEVIICRKP